MQKDKITVDEELDVNFATNIKLGRDERETIINYSELDNKWVVDSSVPKHIRKFEKQGWLCTGKQYYPDGTLMAAQFECPPHGISIRPFEKIKREMSDEQRLVMSERMKKMQESRIK